MPSVSFLFFFDKEDAFSFEWKSSGFTPIIACPLSLRSFQFQHHRCTEGKREKEQWNGNDSKQLDGRV
jgi:hypothetical protein